MSSSVTVRVPARLHLGFLDPSGDAGRRFGSIGLPLSTPETVLTLRRSPETIVEGPESGRAAQHLARLAAALDLKGHHRLTIQEAIPAHAGLGSGTQLALGVAAALRTLHGLPLDIGGDAARLERGRRSGIGIASFMAGGVIVDAGQDSGGLPPPVVARVAFPAGWRALLVLDPHADGLHGEAEITAFRALAPFPRAQVGDICRHVLMGVLPALMAEDFAAFGQSITAIQALVGAHFSPAQGGVFTSRRVERAIRAAQEAGASGIGQSSWGPTGFAFARSEADARRFAEAARTEGDVDVRVVRGRNEGATITNMRLDLVNQA